MRSNSLFDLHDCSDGLLNYWNVPSYLIIPEEQTISFRPDGWGKPFSSSLDSYLILLYPL